MEWYLNEIGIAPRNESELHMEDRRSTSRPRARPIRSDRMDADLRWQRQLCKQHGVQLRPGRKRAGQQPKWLCCVHEYHGHATYRRYHGEGVGTVKRKYLLDYDNSPQHSGQASGNSDRVQQQRRDGLLYAHDLYISGQHPRREHQHPALGPISSVTDASGDYDFNGDGIDDIAYRLSGTGDTSSSARLPVFMLLRSTPALTTGTLMAGSCCRAHWVISCWAYREAPGTSTP